MPRGPGCARSCMPQETLARAKMDAAARRPVDERAVKVGCEGLGVVWMVHGWYMWYGWYMLYGWYMGPWVWRTRAGGSVGIAT
jgi:hypothetical protein